jgi:hypothetical protein
MPRRGAGQTWDEAYRSRYLEALSKIEQRIEDSLYDAGQQVKAAIRARTISGVDIYGRPFKGYEPRTITRKGTTRVTLVGDTGKMLGSLRVYRRRGVEARVQVTGTRNRRIGLDHQLGLNGMPPRPWFGLTPSQRKFIRDEFRQNAERATIEIYSKREEPRVFIDIGVKVPT